MKIGNKNIIKNKANTFSKKSFKGLLMYLILYFIILKGSKKNVVKKILFLWALTP